MTSVHGALQWCATATDPPPKRAQGSSCNGLVRSGEHVWDWENTPEEYSVHIQRLDAEVGLDSPRLQGKTLVLLPYTKIADLTDVFAFVLPVRLAPGALPDTPVSVATCALGGRVTLDRQRFGPHRIVKVSPQMLLLA